MKGSLLGESTSIPVRSAEMVSHQGVHTGIYEGFILAQSTAESALPTQSEPAIPQTLAWSPASFFYLIIGSIIIHAKGKKVFFISHCGKATEIG